MGELREEGEMANRTCPKCGNGGLGILDGANGVVYQPAGAETVVVLTGNRPPFYKLADSGERHDERLRITCSRCGYVWFTVCLDVGEAENASN